MERLRECYCNAQAVIQGGEDIKSSRIRFSDDAKWIFVCSGNHIKVYSYASREMVLLLSHHTREVTAVTLNPRNRMQVISASLDGHLALWDYTDGSLLRVIDFGRPLYKFGMRHGKQDPSLFFVTDTNTMEVDGLDNGNQYTEKVIVGMSSHVITERQHTVAPSDQLAEAQQFIQLGKKPRDFVFTCEDTHLVSFSGRKLLVYDLEAEKLYSYSREYPLTALASHPSKFCIATGNRRGEVQLWYDFGRPRSKVVVTTFHWHAHSVWDLCFTTDGTYLLSGGEESVLVLWQLDTHKKQFRPRLGSPITRVACSPGDKYFTLSLQNNVIRLVSGLDTEVECTLGGLRRAHTQDPGENGVKTGLVLDPHSKSIVLNSTPGFLQFYKPESSTVTQELDVASLNYVSRPEDKPLILTTVDHATFSPDGLWLTTVEGRDDGKTAPELRMKFWEFSSSHQSFILNTCVDPPHEERVTSLTFQPKRRRTSSAECQRANSFSKDHSALTHGKSCRSVCPALMVSTSLDGKFKVWILVDVEGRDGDKESLSWACRSVGYYHNLPCHGAAFCEDGSLLSANFHKYITLWDPYTCDLREKFSSHFPQEDFVHVVFGHHSSSQYLMASSLHHLHVWDLLSCKVVWCVKVCVDLLVSDPFSSLAAAFVPSTTDSTSHLYIFDPSSPTPLAVHGSVCREHVIGAVFIPLGTTKEDKNEYLDPKSKLYFMNRHQVLYSMEDKAASSGTLPNETNLLQERPDQIAQRAFSEIFGDSTKGNSSTDVRSVTAGTHITKSLLTQQLFSAPPHVLPPVSLLCQPFLLTLLPASRTAHECTPGVEDGDTSANHSQSEEEEEDVHPTERSKGTSFPTHSIMEVVEEDSHRKLVDCNVDNYDWLIEHFKSER